MGDLELRAADDWHVHLRDDVRTPAAIAAVRSGGTARLLAMPNTSPPVLSGDDAERYGNWLKAKGLHAYLWTTIKLTQATTPQSILEASSKGVIAAKLYPLGVTTNSEDGLSDPLLLAPVFEAMQSVDMVLSLHGEVPGVFVMDAEAEFLGILQRILDAFPKLRVVLEHVTTKAAVDFVCRFNNDRLAATITDHHLAITLDDVVGSRVRPHHFCMPVAKRPSDLRALREAVRSVNPRFFSGTDSAPHMIRDKLSDCGCAGVFNAPYHMQFLATLFENHEMIDCLEPFTSQFGREFYQVPPGRERIRLLRRPFVVPDRFDGIVPFMAGTTLNYQVEWV
ncbi:MAG: dihydroorotase [Acidobacteria bacterium]|nr:dihydroorotase [Acidobacteriota bacterium]